MRKVAAILAMFLLFPSLPRSQTKPPEFDVVIRAGIVYDGTGGAPMQPDVGIKGDRIVAVGKLQPETVRTVVDASGLAVAPGFINMLSSSTESLIIDGRSQSEIRQGVIGKAISVYSALPNLNCG